MRVLVCGSEEWDAPAILRREFAGLPRGVELVWPEYEEDEPAGAADLAEEMGLADGGEHLWGDDANPDLVLAFLAVPFEECSDVDEAQRRGVPVEIVGGDVTERYLSIKIPLGTGSLEAIQRKIADPLKAGGREHLAAAAAMIGRGIELMLIADRVGRSKPVPLRVGE